MSKPGFWNTSSASPRKIVLIAALGLVLIAVLVWQYGGGSSEDAVQVAANSPQKKKPTAAAADGAGPPNGTALHEALAPWPTFQFDDTVSHDPFEIPETLVPAPQPPTPPTGPNEEAGRAQQDADVLARLRSEGVGLVLVTKEGPIATVGAATIREGDILEGFLVVKIDATGVYLVDKDHESP